MSRLRPDRPRRLLAAGGLVALCGACAHQGGPGVRIQTVASDIVFGAKTMPAAIPPIADATAPAPGPASVDGNGGSDAGNVAPNPPQPDQRLFMPKAVPPVPAPRELCPPALEGAFPAKAATRNVPDRPKAGHYRWKVTVTRTVPGVAQPAVTTDFVVHDIVNVSDVSTLKDPSGQLGDQMSFTYDEVIHNSDNTTTTTTWKVLNNGISETITPPNNTGGVIGPDAGQPDRGLSILRTVKRAQDGKVLSTFSPATPIVVLELPATANATYQGAGADPTNGSSLASNAKIIGHHRVDACGTIIDGWEADTTQAFTTAQGTPPSTATVSYYVATQLGGLVTYIAKQAAVPGSPLIVESIGQLNPDPLH